MTRYLIQAIALLTGLLATAVTGHAASPTRVALVIGNGAYQGAPLRNAVNDARSMGERLSRLGFHVITAENAGRDAMQKSILDFATLLQSDTTGLFYYAGHGIQSRGRNYLLPVDAEVVSERALKFQAVDVQAVLEEMAFAGNRINIVILDACRNNPFERRFRGGSRGLAAIDAARGTLIAYATAPGSLAADGDGANGLYTTELLAALAVPDLKVEEVFKRVRIAVTDRTGGAQVPWESSSLTGDFVFNRQGKATQVAAAAPAAAIASEHEALFWETIKNSDNPRALLEASMLRLTLSEHFLGVEKLINQLKQSIARPTAVPPRIPIKLPYIVSNGIMTMSAMTLGVTRKSIGCMPRVVNASTSSLTFMVPICAAYAAPVRPAMMIAVMIGAISRTIATATRFAV